MKPRKNYRSRPVKSGAAKRQRVLSQKKRLVAAGYTMEELRNKTIVEIRDLVKKVAKKTKKKDPAKKPAAKKPAAKTKTKKKA